MNHTIDDGTLTAYLDGELDPTLCAEVEVVLAADAELRDKVRQLREADSLVRAAFNHILYAPLPKLELPGKASPGARRESEESANGARADGKPIQWPGARALAASLAALALGAGLGYYAPNRAPGADQAATVSRSDETMLNGLFSTVLEKELSGTPVKWTNPETGNHGTITPIRTWRTESGRYCREFEDQRVIAGVAERQIGVSCRSAGGNWKVRMRYFDN